MTTATALRPEVRAPLLVAFAELRAGLLDVEAEGAVGPRVARFYDSLKVWARLPSPAKRVYGGFLVDALFTAAAEVDDAGDIDRMERHVVELSLWDVAVELGLDEMDPGRGAFIARRRIRLFAALSAASRGGVDWLFYSWASLLAPRTEKPKQLPGPFREDVVAVVEELSRLELPRRAKALATKFQVPVDQLVRWNIEHRPESDELAHTRKLLQRITSPPRPLPYSVVTCLPALKAVISAAPATMPMTVGGAGCITVAGRMYGFRKRPKAS